MVVKKQIGRIGILINLLGILSAQNAYDAIHILEREIGFGTRALAMGGAYTAMADDYSAIYWNPAGLGKIKMPELMTELSHLSFNNNARYLNQSAWDNQTYTRFRSIGLAIPLPTAQGSAVLAVGYNRIADFDENLLFSGYSTLSNDLGFTIADSSHGELYYPFDNNVWRQEQVSSEGGLQQFGFGGAVALSPRFIFGATVALTSGQEQYRFRFTQTDSKNLYQVYPGDFQQYQIGQYLESNYRAWSLKLGALIQIASGLQLGGMITLPSSFLIEEVHSFSDELTFDDGFEDATEESGQWDYRVKTPYYFDGGLSYSSRFLILTGAIRYRDWSQTRFMVHRSDYDDEDYLEFLKENDFIRLNYSPTMEYHLGGEMVLDKINTKLRGGYAYYPSPLKGASRDRDREMFTGGIGFTIDTNIDLNITYLNSSYRRATVDSYTPGGTVEDIQMQKFLVGISYRF